MSGKSRERQGRSSQHLMKHTWMRVACSSWYMVTSAVHVLVLQVVKLHLFIWSDVGEKRCLCMSAPGLNSIKMSILSDKYQSYESGVYIGVYCVSDSESECVLWFSYSLLLESSFWMCLSENTLFRKFSCWHDVYYYSSDDEKYSMTPSSLAAERQQEMADVQGISSVCRQNSYWGKGD